MKRTRQRVERELASWLRQGMSPRRLALTLALGFTVGCVPVIGIPTLVCAGLALLLGLNLPAIQVANYAAMPFQLALVAPFLKVGGRLAAFGFKPGAGPLFNLPALQIVSHLGGMAGQALLGWMLFAAPTAAILTAALTLLLRQIPAPAGVQD